MEDNFWNVTWYFLEKTTILIIIHTPLPNTYLRMVLDSLLFQFMSLFVLCSAYRAQPLKLQHLLKTPLFDFGSRGLWFWDWANFWNVTCLFWGKTPYLTLLDTPFPNIHLRPVCLDSFFVFLSVLYLYWDSNTITTQTNLDDLNTIPPLPEHLNNRKSDSSPVLLRKLVWRRLCLYSNGTYYDTFLRKYSTF